MALNSHPNPKPSSEEETSAEEETASEDVEKYKNSSPRKPSAQIQPNTSKTTTSRPQPSFSSYSEPDSQPRPDQKSKPTSPKPVSAKRKKAIGKEAPRKKKKMKPRLEHDEIAILEQPLPDPQSKPVSPKPTLEEPPPKIKAAERKASGVVEETPKKKPRLFCEDDEIAILRGMIKYNKTTGVEPSSDWNAFLEFVRDSLQLAEVKKTQLSEKVRGLRQKYEKSMTRVKENGGVQPEFRNVHDKRVFKLSERIWGSCGGGSGLGNEKANVDNNSKGGSSGEKSEGERVGGFWSGGLFESSGGLCMGEQAVKDKCKLINESDKAELEGRRKELMMEELELYSKKLDLIIMQGKMDLEAMSS